VADRTTYTVSDVVSVMGRMNITGNVTPPIWYRRITLPSGKPDTISVILLSEVVYWYRPREVRDEHTGAVVRYEKRFRADKLQRTYASLADQFGFSKRQISEAMHRLEKRGLIDLDFRTVTTGAGNRIGNVLFIGLDPYAVAELTFDGDNPSDVSAGQLSRQNVTPSHDGTGEAITPEGETCTETTSGEDDVDVPPIPPHTPSPTAPDSAPDPQAQKDEPDQDPTLRAVVALYEQEIGGYLTAMILEELTDLVQKECRDLGRWRAAFQESIGARNRWKYVRAIIAHPERKPPSEVKRGKNSSIGQPRRAGPRPRGAHGRRVTIPSPEEIARLNAEAERQIREQQRANDG